MAEMLKVEPEPNSSTRAFEPFGAFSIAKEENQIDAGALDAALVDAVGGAGWSRGRRAHWRAGTARCWYSSRNSVVLRSPNCCRTA